MAPGRLAILDFPLILLSIFCCAATAFYLAAPFWRKPSTAAKPIFSSINERQHLKERRDFLLGELREMEFDHAMGKVSDDDYARLRATIAIEAADVLQQLEEIGPRAPRKLQASIAPSIRELVEIEAEIEIAVVRARRKNAQSWTCGNCGRVMAAADKFCASCGEKKPGTK